MRVLIPTYASLPCFFFSSRRRHTRLQGDWSSDVCSSDLHRQFECHDRHATDPAGPPRSEEHTSELQSPCNLVCRLLLEKKKNKTKRIHLRRTVRLRLTHTHILDG